MPTDPNYWTRYLRETALILVIIYALFQNPKFRQKPARDIVLAAVIGGVTSLTQFTRAAISPGLTPMIRFGEVLAGIAMLAGCALGALLARRFFPGRLRP